MGTNASNADAAPEGDESPSTATRGRNRNPARDTTANASHLVLNRPYAMNDRSTTLPVDRQQTGSISPVQTREEDVKEVASSSVSSPQPPVRCINPASEVNARLDTQVEVRVYPCNNSQSSSGKKKFTSFTVKPEVSSLNDVLFVLLLLRGWILFFLEREC